MFWGGDEKKHMEGELRISNGRVFQIVAAATAKLREPKHVRSRGRGSKLVGGRSETQRRYSAFTPTASSEPQLLGWCDCLQVDLISVVTCRCRPSSVSVEDRAPPPPPRDLGVRHQLSSEWPRPITCPDSSRVDVLPAAAAAAASCDR